MDKFGHTISFDYGPSSCNPDQAREPGMVCTADGVLWVKFDDTWVRPPYRSAIRCKEEIIACEDEIELLELINNWKDNE